MSKLHAVTLILFFSFGFAGCSEPGTSSKAEPTAPVANAPADMAAGVKEAKKCNLGNRGRPQANELGKNLVVRIPC